MARIIVIAGGIGSGKSVVSQILRCMGYRVYDCDSRAKRIVDNDIAIRREIAEQISSKVLTNDMSLDRKHLAEIVFSDKSKLTILNGIVHAAVRKDITDWSYRYKQERLLFVETAIPKSSGLDDMADAIWVVEAPVDIRISRVCRRNGLDPDSVRQRIEAQKGETEICGKNMSVINNDGRDSILLQINHAIAES